MSPDPRGEARAAVRRLVVAAGGQMTSRPMFRDRPDYDWQREEPEPLAGIQAAVTLEHEARQAVAECARYAREDGLTWEQVGEALFPGALPRGAESKAEAAFEHLSWVYDLWQNRLFTWTCPSCLQLVSDHGPASGGDPSEAEEGHADGCGRLAAAVAAWHARWEDE